MRIAFDGDAVLFDEASELVFQQHGLQAFHRYENEKMDLPMDKGPYADFLIKLSRLQSRLPNDTNADNSPIRIALVTARNAPADMRAIKTLREWGVSVDVAFFLGGLSKTRVLKLLHRIFSLMTMSNILRLHAKLCHQHMFHTTQHHCLMN